MKFGVREITDIVLKATSNGQKLGSTSYNQYDPILFFDSAKTSTLESSVATVYAQGGRGNPRLLAWDGDKVATFTFDDALISAESMALLSGADLNSSVSNALFHATETGISYTEGNAIKVKVTAPSGTPSVSDPTSINVIKIDSSTGEMIEYVTAGSPSVSGSELTLTLTAAQGGSFVSGDTVLVDFYTSATVNSKSIEVVAGKFGGYYYVEANTLFRGVDGKDYPAQFTIPKAKVESNFTFTMASTGDPSTFQFKMDAFPAKTRFGTKKVLFALDVSDTSSDVI